MTNKIVVFIAILLLPIAGCDFSKSSESTTIPTGPTDPVFITISADPVIQNCVDGLFTYDIEVRAHNATAPFTLDIDFGDGISTSVESTTLRVRHTYHGCGIPDQEELGWTIRATVTTNDGNHESADKAVFPCSQC